MSRLELEPFLSKGSLRCPTCRGGLESRRSNSLSLYCKRCSHTYEVIDGCPMMAPLKMNSDGPKREIQNFWGELLRETYKDTIAGPEQFSELLALLEKLFRHRRHLAVCEMPVDDLERKEILEVGSGTGVHSAFFAWKRGHVVALDLTQERVLATAKKLDLIQGNGHNFSLQGDAERLPFADKSFDIVYSNGVLHHTPKTDEAIREIYRVLRPGGKAIIMLYARNSYLYWINMFFLKGLLLGHIFRRKNWLGHNTEWMAKGKQKVFNPETKVYSRKEILTMFSDFKEASIRKNGFVIQQVPFIGKILSPLLAKVTGFNHAGILLYGQPWRNETRWEITLGRKIGFGLNILAVK